MATFDWSNHPLLKAFEGAPLVHLPHLAGLWTEDTLEPVTRGALDELLGKQSYEVLIFDSDEDYQQWLKEQNDEKTGNCNEGQQERESVRQEG
jgi:hypothetical protein